MVRKNCPPRIETERLVLRVPSIFDAPAVNAAQRESFAELQRWMKWATSPITLEETTAYARMASEVFGAGEDFALWAFLKSHYLSNRAYENYDHLFQSCGQAWNQLTTEQLRSICHTAWIPPTN